MMFTQDDWEKVAAIMVWKARRGRRPVTIRKSEVDEFAASGLTFCVTVDRDFVRLHLITPVEAAKLREHQARIAREVTP